MCSATMRVSVSIGPPAAAGTMIVIGLWNVVCAWAESVAAIKADAKYPILANIAPSSVYGSPTLNHLSIEAASEWSFSDGDSDAQSSARVSIRGAPDRHTGGEAPGNPKPG